MSAEDSRDIEPGRGRWERSQQTAHWRSIGISAVAAAARYPAAPVPPIAASGAAPAKADPAGNRIVTLRDIELLSS